MQELWKDIKGYEGLYQVSNLGNVKRLARKISYNGTLSMCKEIILKPKKVKYNDNRPDRWQVNLYKNGKMTTFHLHRLVAQTFIPNPENKPTVNHIDGNPSNNNLENLEWATYSENIKHAFKNKLIKTFSKLSEKDMDFIRENYKFRKKGFGSNTISKMLGGKVDRTTILNFVKQKNHKDYWEKVNAK